MAALTARASAEIQLSIVVSLINPYGESHRLFNNAARAIINFATTFLNAHGIGFDRRDGVQDLLRQAAYQAVPSASVAIADHADVEVVAHDVSLCATGHQLHQRLVQDVRNDLGLGVLVARHAVAHRGGLIHAWKSRQRERVQRPGLSLGSGGKGSCLYLHWQTILPPARIAEYVVMHEMAHLHEPHPTPKYRRRAARAMPDFGQRGAWLAAHEELEGTSASRQAVTPCAVGNIGQTP